MSEEQTQGKKNWISTILKIVFFAAAFFLIIFTVMANMGGPGDTYKESIEDLISERTGFVASIQNFNGMTFYPNVSLDFEGLELFPDQESTNPVAYMGKLQLAVGFWDIAFSTGKVKVFNIEKLHALPGTFFKKSIQVDHLSFDKSEGDQSQFSAAGKVGAHSVLASMEVEFEKGGYKFGSERNIDVQVDDTSFTAVLKIGKEGLSLEQLDVASEGNREVYCSVMRLFKKYGIKNTDESCGPDS